MRILGKHLDAIEPDDILTIVGSKLEESLELDYKAKLPGNSNKEKKEFLADVSSFANRVGGVLVFGVSEEIGQGDEKSGRPDEIVGLTKLDDDEITRLEQILLSGLAPKILGIKFKPLEVEEKKVLIIGIPRSLNGPHLVWFERNGKFHMRHNTGKDQMNVYEIEQSFLSKSSWIEEARAFRNERLNYLSRDDITPDIVKDHQLVVHIYPLGAMKREVDLVANKDSLSRVLPPNASGHYRRFNSDGFLLFDKNDTPVKTWMQIFRNGSIEYFTSKPVEPFATSDDPPCDAVDGHALEASIISSIVFGLRIQETLNMTPPCAVFASLRGLAGRSIFVRSEWHNNSLQKASMENRIDSKLMLLPEVFCQSESQELEELLKNMLDALWQSSGRDCSPFASQRSRWISEYEASVGGYLGNGR